MKLVTVTNVTLDGVIQGLGGPEEDRRGGFERGGWALAMWDEPGAAYLGAVYQRADAFLFGRYTYDVFAGHWGVIDDPANAIAAALNARPKYVVSSTLTDPAWSDTTVVTGDLETAIRELKARPGGELQVHGSASLLRWLWDRQLVDELVLVTYPLVIGQGARLFPEAGPDVALELVESRAVGTNGVLAHVYRPAGRPAYA